MTPPSSQIPPRDPFRRLPSELLLKILKGLPDLSSLWGIVSTSTAVGEVLSAYAVEIVEAVIFSTVPVSIQCLMYAVLQVRASETAGNCTLLGLRSLPGQHRSSLAETKIDKPELFVEFLSLAHSIHVLAHTCIDHYIQKSMALKPLSLVHMDYTLMSRPDDVQEAYERAESRPCEPQRTGPPSWIEEQRVIRALWRIQLLLELRVAREEKRLPWSEDDLAMLTSMNASEFYRIPEWEREQLLTVEEYIQQLGEDAETHHIFQLPGIDLENSSLGSCAQPCLQTTKENPWQQTPRHLDRATNSYKFQIAMAFALKYTPLPGMPFQPYRKFGFAIWDEKRMADLGFAAPDGRTILHRTEYYFTWYHALTEDERRGIRVRQHPVHHIDG